MNTFKFLYYINFHKYFLNSLNVSSKKDEKSLVYNTYIMTITSNYQLVCNLSSIV